MTKGSLERTILQNTLKREPVLGQARLLQERVTKEDYLVVRLLYSSEVSVGFIVSDRLVNINYRSLTAIL